jgi:hypothetical protein
MRRSLLSMCSLLAVAVLAFGAPRAASAQQGDQVLDAQVDSAVAMFRGQGFSLSRQERGSLAEDASRDVTMEIPAGKRAIVVAVCDNSCSDIDLEVFKGAQSVGSDFEPDDVPIVILEGQSGTVRVKVSMATCSGTCGYRLMLFVD